MLYLSLIITCCYRTEVVQYGSANTDPATFASGQQLPTRPKNYTYFCNPATLARKGCKFLSKYDDALPEAFDTNLYASPLYLGKTKDTGKDLKCKTSTLCCPDFLKGNGPKPQFFLRHGFRT